ncbi:MAG: cereblon family protein [Planctomycetes bacterium]|nr:cereblon family protein [Planctomycetota bacterium]
MVAPLAPPPPDLAPAPATRERTAADPVLACARCGHAITRPAARVARGGAHVHTRINPYGYVFQLGCFDPAEGCAPEGPATLEHTWFAGHAWRLGTCRACGEHLGWRFEGETGVFWGLILDRLREA